MKYVVTVLAFALCLVLSSGCTKESDKNTEKPIRAYPNQDLGIRFTRYEKGMLYTGNDTIRNNFAIKNYGPLDLKKGDTLKAACRIGGVLWALDLIGEGPSPIVLEHDLKVGQELNYNPGYLLGHTILEYFKINAVNLCIMVYGVNKTITNETFASDPQKDNNKDCLNFSASGIQLN